MRTTKGRREARGTNGENKIRYAVVGLGHIAQAAVLPGFAHAKNSELVALVTGDSTKARQLSRKYCVESVYSYKNYHKCLANGGIDAVYIALPNDMHRQYSVAASNAGVHVLCEKPMAMDEKECKEMIEASNRNNTKLMIAYRLHFNRANLKAVDLANSGKLGQLRIFNSTFTLQVRRGNIRLQKSHAGGPLWDIGVYCINAARYFFRDEPEEVVAFAAKSSDKRFKEVEETVSAVLRFPNERLAAFSCSFGASDNSSYEVVGTKGTLRADPGYEYAEGLKFTVTIDGNAREYAFAKSDQFGPQLFYFSDCILKNRAPEPSGEEGLADVRIIRALFSSIASGKPVSIEAAKAAPRPSIRQEIQRAPVDKPELVHAQSSSTD